MFDAAPESGAVGAAGRRYSVFTEARFAADGRGGWAALDASNGPAAWHRYLTAVGRICVVARAQDRRADDAIALPGSVEVASLPYYVGPAGLARTFPALLMQTWRAVARAEVIVLRVPGVIGSLAAVACRALRRRYAVQVFGDPADSVCGILGAKGRALRPLVLAFQRWLIRNADASVFVTDKTLQRRYPPKAGTLTVGIAEIGLRPQDFVRAPRTWPGPEHLRVVTIGSQETAYKGHDVLLRAIAEVVVRGLDVSATIIGGGRLHDDLRRLADDLGIGHRVRFTGAIASREQINALLDEASLFVLPSRTEGLPRVLIEAMARALPALGSDVGGIPELLEPSCLVPIGDSRALATGIARIFGDAELWSRQSARNLETARGYDPTILDERFGGWLHMVPAARDRGNAARTERRVST